MLNLKDKAWSPYAAGIILGLLQIPALILLSSMLDVSAAYSASGSYISGLFGMESVSAPALWLIVLAVGIILGAMISTNMSGMKRHSPAKVWDKIVGPEKAAKRMPIAFLGGVVLMLGASIAGGATIAHGISGLALLSVGSILTVVSLFVGGMIMIRLLNKA